MGGKLFDLPRMPRADYLERERAVRAYLDDKLGGEYRIPRFYGDKVDFGDMDVIVCLRPDWVELRAAIMRDLGIEQSKTAGHLFSTVYRGLQTDFFAVEPRHLESTYVFMSFNDLGNLLGRICRRFNLKWGVHGLAYVYRRGDDGHYQADLPVTEDFARLCAFLGLDHAAWLRGFDSLDALFAWVVASPHFSVAPYLDDGRAAVVRKGRPTLARFVEYLRAQGIDRRPTFGDRTSYLPLLVEHFPEADLEGQIAAERARQARAEELARRFNGQLVMRLRPDLEGAALGQFIVSLKASFDDFDAYVLTASPAELEARIRTHGASG